VICLQPGVPPLLTPIFRYFSRNAVSFEDTFSFRDLASLTGGDCSIGIVRLWTKTTEIFFYIHCFVLIYVCIVSIAIGCGLDGWGSVLIRGKIFVFSTAFIPGLGLIQPLIRWERQRGGGNSRRVKREADHLPQSCSEVKNGGAIPPLYPILCTFNGAHML
jgi:hypothetical protein